MDNERYRYGTYTGSVATGHSTTGLGITSSDMLSMSQGNAIIVSHPLSWFMGVTGLEINEKNKLILLLL